MIDKNTELYNSNFKISSSLIKSILAEILKPSLLKSNEN